MKPDFYYLLTRSFELLTVAPQLIPEALQQPALRNPIAISFGAVSGSLSRYYLSIWLAQKFSSTFPYSTLFINITGCLGMGFFVTLALERVASISPEIRLLVAVGFLGSYTTFSTYELDAITLLQNRSWQAAGLYWFGSAIAGIFSLYLGIILARIVK